MHVFGLRKEARAPEQNMQTLHTEPQILILRQPVDSNPVPSFYNINSRGPVPVLGSGVGDHCYRV